ncbi:MAG: hypothetical protein Q9169_008297 [Polycauliona sp. 2 TL-2023]
MVPSSARQRGTPSTARPSAASARQTSRPATALPTYQPLAHPLNSNAQFALHNLPTTHPLNDLKQRLNIATSHLNDVTGDLNDQYHAKKTSFEKEKSQKAARARELESSQGGEDDDDRANTRMDDAWKEVENFTGRMEARTRQVIDLQARVENTETVLKELNANVSNSRTSTQSTLGASQFRSQTQRQRRGRVPGQFDSWDEESEDDDENGAATHEERPTPALATFKTKLSTAQTNYTSLSMKDRYASHNTYLGFRQIVHDARHPNDDTPMPDPSTWFPSSTNSKSANSNNRTRNQHPNSSEEDDDIQIARIKRSIRCPITLLPLSSPLTSTRCPHSFESSAIESMLAASPLRAVPNPNNNNKPMLNPHGARGGVNALKCPECEILLTRDELYVDVALVRRIRRVVEMERREREEEEEEESDEGGRGGGRGGGGVEMITSSPVKGRGWSQRARSVKRERMSQMVGQRTREREREISMVPDSQVVDLGSGEDVEDDDN